MNRPVLSPGVFLVSYCCAYMLVFATDWPLFRYYPLHGDFSWGTQVLPGIGPAMAWYGLMASALLVALPAAFIVPQRAVDRVLGDYLWLFPVGAMLISVFLMRRFLF